MIKVAALTAGKNTPSTRFRVRQHIAPLRALDVQVDEYIPAIDKASKVPLLPASVKPRYVPPVYMGWIGVKAATRLPGLIGSWTHQVTWLQRELIPGLYTVERFLRKPIVFDVDDAIWLVSLWAERTSRAIARRSDVVMAGNSFLADWYSQYAKDVRIVPTAVDTGRFTPRKRDADGRFIVGWTGSFGTLPYLEAIEPALHRFFSAHPKAMLRIVCDKQPNFRLLRGDQVEFIDWSPDVEVSGIQSIDVGLMPLEDSLWTRGKCSFKMLQYMSCEIPSVVTPVGMNKDVLALGTVGMAAETQDQWVEALDFYFDNPAAAAAHGKSGRAVILNHFSQALVAEQIAGIFRELA